MFLDNLTLFAGQDAILGILFFFISGLFPRLVSSSENIWLTMTFNWFLELGFMIFCRTSSAILQFIKMAMIGLGSDLLFLWLESVSLVLWALLICIPILSKEWGKLRLSVIKPASNCDVLSHVYFDSSGVPLEIRLDLIDQFLKSPSSRSTTRSLVSILLMWRSSLTCVINLFDSSSLVSWCFSKT